MEEQINISLRPSEPGDRPFLRDVYASTREKELKVTGWSREECDRFIAQQFHTQDTYYRQTFPDTAFDVILADGVPAGRLYLDRRADEFRIIDIALLTSWRGKGIGRRLMEDVIAEAENAGLPVRIHVEHNNPAMGLYERLGFKNIGDTEVYYLMERVPSRDPVAAEA